MKKYDVQYVTVIHPSAIIPPISSLGHGTVTFSQSVIIAGMLVGKYCIIKTKVESDCKLVDYVNLAPGIICENAPIGSLTCIGPGTVILKNLKSRQKCDNRRW